MIECNLKGIHLYLRTQFLLFTLQSYSTSSKDTVCLVHISGFDLNWISLLSNEAWQTPLLKKYEHNMLWLLKMVANFPSTITIVATKQGEVHGTYVGRLLLNDTYIQSPRPHLAICITMLTSKSSTCIECNLMAISNSTTSLKLDGQLEPMTCLICHQDQKGTIHAHAPTKSQQKIGRYLLPYQECWQSCVREYMSDSNLF